MDVDELFALFDTQIDMKSFPPIGEALDGMDFDESSELAAYDIKIPKSSLMGGVSEVGKREVYKSYKQAKKEIMDGIIGLSGASSVWQVFSDWIALGATLISNIYDATHSKERQELLVELDKQYTREQEQRMLELFAKLSELICRAFESGEFYDFLGEIYEELGLGNNKNGQYFTPNSIARMMGDITASEISVKTIEKRGFITVMEPASGSGSMILGVLSSLKKQGIDYKTQCAVLAVDNDIRCVHMCYIQLALYGVPAVIQHGDSITLQAWSRWYTPVYILDDWVWRAGLTLTTGRNLENERLKCYHHPMYGIMMYGLPNLEIA